MRGKQKTNDEFHRELIEKCPGIYTDDIYINATTKITFYCDNGHSWLATPNSVLSMRSKCPCCAGQKPIVGETDLWTTRPDIAMLLVNRKDGYVCTEYSHKKLNFKCPNCNTEFKQDLNHVSARGLSCPICSDGISYPNKFMRNVLSRLKVDYTTEYSPEWISPKRYDFYFEINDNSYIVEMDGGLGHGNDPRGSTWFDKKKSIETDEYKDMMALQHGIEVIRINCNYSAETVTKNMCNNILLSKLGNLFDFSCVDFNDCERCAQKSIFYEVCNLWSQSIYSEEDIANKLKMSITYIKNTLKKGNRLGIVKYEKRFNSSRFVAKDDPVICIETGERFIGPNDVFKKLGIKIYNVIDSPNRSAGKLLDGRKLHWKRLDENASKSFIKEYYSKQ